MAAIKAAYCLRVGLDSSVLKQFRESKMKLYFASVQLSDDSSTYQQFSACDVNAPVTSWEWTPEYGMAVSQADSVDSATPNITPIAFGQSYIPPSAGGNPTIQNDANAPRRGFRIMRQGNDATVILYRKIEGKWTSVHRSQPPTLLKAVEDLTPIEKVKVWFATESTKTRIMVSEVKTQEIEVDFTTAGQFINLKYDEKGDWSIVPRL